MPELRPAPALAALEATSPDGRVFARLRDGLSIVSVLGRKDAAAALCDKAQEAFSLALCDGPRRATAGDLSALGIGPARWLFVRASDQLLAELAAEFSGLASLSDQSDGYAVFEIWGPAARQALAKGVPVDLAPSAFTDADVAVTSIAHIGAVVWREEERFSVAVFRSYAASFWHWLAASSAEFGLAAGEK